MSADRLAATRRLLRLHVQGLQIDAHAALDDAGFQRVFHGNAFERAPRPRRHGWRRTLRALWVWLWQPSPWGRVR